MQHLSLPRSKKNASDEVVAGAITRTRGFVWFNVSDVEDDLQKVGVEAYIRAKEDNIGSTPACILFRLLSGGTTNPI